MYSIERKVGRLVVMRLGEPPDMAEAQAFADELIQTLQPLAPSRALLCSDLRTNTPFKPDVLQFIIDTMRRNKAIVERAGALVSPAAGQAYTAAQRKADYPHWLVANTAGEIYGFLAMAATEAERLAIVRHLDVMPSFGAPASPKALDTQRTIPGIKGANIDSGGIDSGLNMATFLADASRMSLEAFVARHPHPVFLFQRNAMGEGSFTGDTALSANVFDDASVFVVRRNRDTAFTLNRITIGRSRSNDITLNAGNISKHHAFLDTTEAPATYKIGDSGSTNGTLLDDQAVGRTPLPMQSGARVTFGSHTFYFLLPAAFYHILRRRHMRKAPAESAAADAPRMPMPPTPTTMERRKPVVMLIANNEVHSKSMSVALSNKYTVNVCRAALTSLVEVRRSQPDVVLVDADKLNHDVPWFVREIRRLDSDVPIVLSMSDADRQKHEDMFAEYNAILHLSSANTPVEMVDFALRDAGDSARNR